ncbi:MAG: hypothetical protein WCF85_08460 [Rhodospirillaceae bacterium]
MPIEIIVALLAAAIALGLGLVKSYHVVIDAKGRIEKLIGTKTGQVERLRRAGRTSLLLKRSIKDGTHRREATASELEDSEAQLEAARAIDHRLYVLDDRRTKADFNWIITINNSVYLKLVAQNALPEAAESWEKGRRFLVFALDANKARDKAAARYPDRQGFRILSVNAQEAAGTGKTKKVEAIN